MPHVLEKVRKQAANASELDLFFDMSIDLMCISSLDGSVLRFNNAWSKTFGYTQEELAEKNPWSTIHHSDIEKCKEAFAIMKSGKQTLNNFECRHVTKDGTFRYINWNSIIDPENNKVYSEGRDVTEQHYRNAELQESEEKFKFLSENAFDGLCITHNGIILTVNKAFLSIFGLKEESDVIGHQYIDLVDISQRTYVKDIVNKGSEEAYQVFIVRKDNRRRLVEVQGRNIFYNNMQCRIAVIRDLEEKLQTQQKLITTEARFKAVFQNTSFGIILTDLDGTVIEANEAIAERLGYKQEDMTGMPMTGIIHNEDIQMTMDYFGTLISGKAEKTVSERRLLKKNKSIAWSRVTCSLVNVNPSSRVVLALVEDIDDHKKNEQALSESVEKFRTIYESSPAGIVITKKTGIIVDANPAFCEMLGYNREELIGTNKINYTHQNDVTKTEKWFDKIYSGEIQSFDFEKKYRRKDGSSVWTKMVVTAMNISGELYTLGVVENIEKRKRTEQSLEQKNKELQQTNQELEHFAYVASHDLQEPLRTITSFIQILDKRYSDKVDKDGRQFMSFVVEGAKRMQNLIQDLLQYSRINRHTAAFEPIDLNEIFTTVNRVLKDKIDSNDAIVLCEYLPEVMGSRMQLTQVFQNMIDNAIKFRGKQKPEIIISTVEHADKYEIIFKDNGIGISPEYYQRIFVIFQRLHTHEEYTGTGIGLAVCKKIIERHGGEVWVDSKPGKGSTFHLTIAKNITAPVS